MAQRTLDWLGQCLPTSSAAVQFLPVASVDEVTYSARTEPELICSGECPLDCDEFTHFIQTLGLHSESRPFVANENVTSQPEWEFKDVRQVIVVPLVEADNHFGWLTAINHEDDEEFGTVEASLLNSIGALLGIHADNRELYRQLAELLANVVHALTSAIDAKDPYTCGHSDRVARVAVRLARELGCDQTTINTMYMAGLLHDVGKIGNRAFLGVKYDGALHTASSKFRFRFIRFIPVFAVLRCIACTSKNATSTATKSTPASLRRTWRNSKCIGQWRRLERLFDRTLLSARTASYFVQLR